MKKISRPINILLLLCALVCSACKGKKPASSGNIEANPPPVVDTRFQDKFFAAQLEKSKGNSDKAYQFFDEALSLQPDNDAVHYELGRMDLQLKNNAESALAHSKAAINKKPKNPWYHLLAGDCHMAMAKFDLATKSYQQVAVLNPDDPNILFEIATAQLYDEKVNDAIATYNELEKQSGPYEELSMQKHQLYLQLNEPEKAGLEIEKLARAFPDEPRFWGIAAQYYTTVSMPEKAKYALEEMIKSDPDNGQVHFQLSEYYAATGDDERSYEELKKAFTTTDISIDQKVGVLLKYFSLTDFNRSYLPQAYELLSITEQMHPAEAKSYSIYGDFLSREGRDLEALEKYRKACELDASRSIIWEQILMLDNTVKDYEAMARESQVAMEFFPHLPQFYYYNGVANQKLKAYSKAIESLSIGKELVVDDPALLARFYTEMGAAYHQQNNHLKSDEAFENALKAQPDNVYVLNNYAYYLTLRKTKLDRAAEMALKANTLQPGQASFEDTYACVLFGQEKFADALIWIEKALVHDEANGELTEHYGDVLFKLNRTNDAVVKWKEAKLLGGTSDRIDQKINEQKYVE